MPAKRIEWLTGRTKYEISSITAKIGRSGRGADDTQNRPKKPAPFFTKPTIVTVRKTESARIAVTAKCDVVVNDVGIPRSSPLR